MLLKTPCGPQWALELQIRPLCSLRDCINNSLAKSETSFPNQSHILGIGSREQRSTCLHAFTQLTSCCTSYVTLGIILNLYIFLVAQTGKRLPTMQETGVRSLGREDPLEKAMAPHSRTLAWKIGHSKPLLLIYIYFSNNFFSTNILAIRPTETVVQAHLMKYH